MLHTTDLLLQMIISNLRVMPENERVDAVVRATDAQPHLLRTRPHTKALRRLVQTQRLARVAPALAHAAQGDGEGYHLDHNVGMRRSRARKRITQSLDAEVRCRSLTCVMPRNVSRKNGWN